ncbi:PLC-like phosphodiesterase [Crepidotus variabilis]|uniref:PLC-like phosphodiesterase n=1 Tax=Crepidotus variabilis TaxID=179855 RepID=A0A9P6EPG5_9AGAR|nr:PLC-like phosphodiesterase [Crepidotus variabilis]
MSSYLSLLPDRLPMSSVALPGTHDTMARYGWPISQCQNVSLAGQLRAGIRVIDIRLAVIPPPIRSARTSTLTAAPNQRLVAYHGIYPQQTPFDDILNDVYQFLSTPPAQRETIVMSIKQEDGQITPAAYFATAIRQAITNGSGGWNEGAPSQPGVNRGMWFLENRIPTLGEVRGKVVLLSRFGGDGSAWPEGFEGIGIHPTTWPDSRKEGFEWELKGTRVRTHDWYAIPTFMSIPEKMQRGTANLLPPQPLTQPLLPITFFSAASFPLSLPPVIAKGFGMPKLGFGIEGVNSRLGKWLLDQIGGISPPTIANEGAKPNHQDVKEEPRIRGWSFLDYFADPEEGQVVPLLVECNFLGRKAGEEGW